MRFLFNNFQGTAFVRFNICSLDRCSVSRTGPFTGDGSRRRRESLDKSGLKDHDISKQTAVAQVSISGKRTHQIAPHVEGFDKVCPL